MNNAWNEVWNQVYEQDRANDDGAGGRIQWKGTDVCIDIWCKCSESAHIDGDFFYHWRCPACGQWYATGERIKLLPMTDEQAKELVP